jgi:hypothetical protein
MKGMYKMYRRPPSGCQIVVQSILGLALIWGVAIFLASAVGSAAVIPLGVALVITIVALLRAPTYMRKVRKLRDAWDRL